MPPAAETSDAEIIHDLYADLVRFAAVVGRAADEPDDLVHDALVRTIARRPLAELDNPRAYLRRAILNLASNRRRSLARRVRAIARLDPASATEDAYPSDVAALLDLTPETRAVLWLADVEGLSFDEIAEALGSSAQSARQRASRGRQELRLRIARGDFRAPTDVEGVTP